MNKENLKRKKIDIYPYLKEYGFINQSTEIYNGFSKFWDFGINGAIIKNNIKNLWIDFFVNTEENSFLFESPILTHKKVLESSGHIKNFNDWIVKCKKCKKKERIDNILSRKENTLFLISKKKEGFFLKKQCSCGGNFENPEKFNLMLETKINSKTEENCNEETVYLRPETCQGIFINFKNILRKVNKKIPFGIAQIGKSFRNEITLNHGIFRMREFEQAEFEFFTNSDEKEEWWKYWIKKAEGFFLKLIVKRNDLLTKKNILKAELPHYSIKTIDLYFKYNFGWGETCSISDRGDYDLKNHSEKSSKFLGTNEISKTFPEVIEISFGIERIMLAILEASYKEEIINKSNLTRKYLKLHPLISPYFVSVIPLSKQLRKESKEIYRKLLKLNIFSVSYEETGNIGNRYRRQDSIGTKFCITIDFNTKGSNQVTIRERDSMKQEKINIEEIENYLLSNLLKEKKEFAE